MCFTVTVEAGPIPPTLPGLANLEEEPLDHDATDFLQLVLKRQTTAALRAEDENLPMQLATEELVTLGTGDLQNQFHCLLSCLQQFIDYLDNLEVTHLPDVVPHAPQPQQLYQSANERLPAQTKHRVQILLVCRPGTTWQSW